MVHQYGLVEKTKEYNLENAAKGYLPQFALSAKASYQSDVTEIPVKTSRSRFKRIAQRPISGHVGVATEDMGRGRNPYAEEADDCRG